MSDENKYQIINIELSNGHVIKAAVPVFCTEAEISNMTIIGFKITEPLELDDNCYWSPIKSSDIAQGRKEVNN